MLIIHFIFAKTKKDHNQNELLFLHSLFLPNFFIFFSYNISNAQFYLNGSAIQISDECFQLTPAVNNNVGSIWFEEKINLNESFEVLMDMKLGCTDANGADGVVFGFQPVSTNIGSNGGGIGFSGVVPSLGIEFDTWQNTNFSDPSADHIAIVRDGNLNHATTAGSLAGPIQANATNINIEDCQYHKMRLTWDATSQVLTVYFDCEERLSYSADIVNTIFGGNPEVFWGFTSATGGANNVHEVCFKYSTFLDGFEDIVICPGGQYQLNISGGETYEWSPPTGLSNPNIGNPIAAPEETTTYLVTVYDECNNPFTDEITVFVDGDTVFFELGQDTTLCELETLILDATSVGNSVYEWADGLSNAQRIVTNSGTYSVTVTIDEYCVAEDNITINYLTLPYINEINDTTLCENQSIILDVNIGLENEYLWSNGLDIPQITISEVGNYAVSISNECGEVEASIRIDFTDCESLYIPSAFSPNNDGINDLFSIYSDGDIEEIHAFKIFNRWGELIYDEKNTSTNFTYPSWDGTYKGKDLNSAVFVWYLNLTFKNGANKLLYGDVNLIK